MGNNEPFSLGPRLTLCAELLRAGEPMADIGTDHGYLPIWLLKTGAAPRAIASDINSGPLEAARRHAQIYGVGDELRLVQSDGLHALDPGDAEDIVIAGMGGELILHIIRETPWLLYADKRLVLQPMSAVDKLRIGLWQLGFAVQRELAAEENGKVYSAFSVEFAGEMGDMPVLWPYMGKLEPGVQAVSAYADKTLRGLRNSLRGAEHNGRLEEAAYLRAVIEGIEKEYAG